MNLNKMTKEDLEQLSYTKIAELYLIENKKAMTTAELFKEVCNLLELGESEYQQLIADFFQSLTTSKDFILLDDGKWDLREKHVVKIQIEDEDEDEEKNDEATEEELEEEDGYDPTEDSYIDDNEDLSELTIVNEDEIEEE